MKIKTRLWGIVTLLIVILIPLSGCGQEKYLDKSDSISYVLEQEPSSLDPAKSTTLPESTVELQIFEGLTRMDEQDQPKPAAAEKWTVSPDGTIYTFTLRKGMTWSNGDPVTAKDFEYAWKRALNPKVGANNAYMLYVLKNGEEYFKGKASVDDVGVKALDDLTLQVTLNAPTSYFLGLTAFHAYYPVPQKVVEENPDNWATNAKTIVGNGPFIMTEWKHSGEMRFKKNATYWDAKAVKLAGMDWPISESQSTRLSLVEGGEADMMVEPPVADQARLTEKGIFKVVPALGTYYYVFNVTAPPLDNPDVRKALTMVINRKDIVDNVVHGGKTPAFSFVPPGLKNPATQQDFRSEGGNYIQENVERAKQLLTKAGYGPSHPLPKIVILFNTNEMHKAIAEAIQATWKEKLGIEVELQNQESKVFLSNREQGNYMVARASWIGDYADPQTFLDVFSDPTNDAQYHNEVYNDLMRKVAVTQDIGSRMKSLHEAENILFQDNVIMPIYYTTEPFVTTGEITDYHWSVLGTVDFKKAYRVNVK